MDTQQQMLRQYRYIGIQEHMINKQSYLRKDYRFQQDKQSHFQFHHSSNLLHIYVQSFHLKVLVFKLLQYNSSQLHMEKQ